jgi:ABC-2 type transport system ATP-binding protein
MNAVECNHLSKNYGNQKALDDVTFSIGEGLIYGLLGVNGAGKTTLLNCLLGLKKPSEGSAKVFGFDILKETDEIKKIADISPQETSVAPNLTVKENLQFFCSLYGRDRQTVENILKTFSLEGEQNKKAKTLSGGYMRRLSIAAALVSQPRILFLDEPTLGLDVLSRRELWKTIEALRGKMTIVLTSHYLEEIEHLCDRVAVLKSGHLVAEGTVNELIERTKSPNFEEAFIRLVEGGEGGTI